MVDNQYGILYSTLPFKSINYIFDILQILLPNFSTYIIQLFKYKQFLILITFHFYISTKLYSRIFFNFFFLIFQHYSMKKKLNKSNYIIFDSTRS